jgi:hypothetical protein
MATPEELAQQQKALDDVTRAQERYSQTVGSTNDILSAARELSDRLKTKLMELGSGTTNLSNGFTIAAASLMKFRESFVGLSGLDQTPFSTMRDQLGSIKDALLSGGVAAKDAASAVGAATKAALGLGASQSQVNEAMSRGKTAVFDLLDNFLRGADNALRLQNALIQTAAQTGTLSDLFRESGVQLENLDNIMSRHQELVSTTAEATGLLSRDVEQYWSQLRSIPRALEQTITDTGRLGGSMDMLSATIQMARGSGRGFTDVVDDMREAFRTYNLVGADALEFSARIGEVANTLGIELSDVRDQVRSVAETFKFYSTQADDSAKFTENAAATMEKYVRALQASGLSGRTAVQIFGNLKDQINNMSIAQKAFISAQTGGPGGLMGFFQIEQMMRTGKIDEVFERVRRTLQRQLGSFVTVDEAARSPQAAAQMTRQIALLRQGPLGSMARTDQEAMKVLEAFSKIEKGQISAKDATTKVFKESIDRGQQIQERSFTELHAIRGILERSAGAAGVPTLRTMRQYGLTAAPGPEPESDAAQRAKEALRRHQTMSFGAAAEAGMDIQRKELIDMSKTYTDKLIQEYSSVFEDIPDIGGILGDFAEDIKGGIQRMSGSIGAANIQTVQARRGAATPGSQLRAAATTSAQTAIATPGTTATPIPTPGRAEAGITPGPSGSLILHNRIEGLCINCGIEMVGSEQQFSVNPSSKTTLRGH